MPSTAPTNLNVDVTIQTSATLTFDDQFDSEDKIVLKHRADPEWWGRQVETCENVRYL